MRGYYIWSMMMEIYLLLGRPFIRSDFRIRTFRSFLSFRCLTWRLLRFGRSCWIDNFRHHNLRRLTWTTRAQTVAERLPFWAHDHFFGLWRCFTYLALPKAIWTWRHLRFCIMPVTRRSRSARILWIWVVWASGRQWPLLGAILFHIPISYLLNILSYFM